MKRLIGFLLLANLTLFYSCQKEVSNEASKDISQGSLQSDISGDCLPKTVAGIYEEGVALTSTNFIEIQVDVNTTGSYVISTDSLNGMSFRATGTFSSTGLNTVKLLGKGTPLLAGIQNFTVTYDSTVCVIPVTTLPPGGAVPATFTLGGAPGACTGAVLSGNYVLNTPMTIANTVNITINVTVIGTFNITSNTVNGIQFSASGSIGTTGPQVITLTATGTPSAAGNTTLQISGGSSVCSIIVPVAATADDYFPRTANSNWSYEYDDTANDSLLIVAKSGTTVIATNTYNVFEATDNAALGFAFWGNYRKSGSNYNTYADMGAYFGFDNAVNIEYAFLKDDQPVNTTWNSPTINGMYGTLAVSVRLVFTITGKGETITVKSIPYTDVITVRESYEVFDGTNWVSATGDIGYFKTYYAKNIGMIKQEYFFEANNQNPPLDYKQELRRYRIF